MKNVILTDEDPHYAEQLLGFLLETLGQIETAKSITIKDAQDDSEDIGGRFAETLDDFESVEGKDLVFEDTQSTATGGISKPIKALEVIDERSERSKKEGSEFHMIWDVRRKCYVKRRKSII